MTKSSGSFAGNHNTPIPRGGSLRIQPENDQIEVPGAGFNKTTSTETQIVGKKLKGGGISFPDGNMRRADEDPNRYRQM